MKVVTAVENFNIKDNQISVFLAGGITGCEIWQSDVIAKLQEIPGLDDLVIFNPRRDNFPINDPNASYEQIKWEFDHLQLMHIFSMFFCGGDSVQPICMYELGRNLLTMHIRFPSDWKNRIIISCDTAYKRKQDLEIQVGLAMNESDAIFFSDDYNMLINLHAKAIANAYFKLKAV